MKVLIYALAVSIPLFGCTDNDVQSDVDKNWLNSTITDIENHDLSQYFYIEKAEYEGECIAYVNNCCPMCNTIIILYRCDPESRSHKN